MSFDADKCAGRVLSITSDGQRNRAEMRAELAKELQAIYDAGAARWAVRNNALDERAYWAGRLLTGLYDKAIEDGRAEGKAEFEIIQKIVRGETR